MKHEQGTTLVNVLITLGIIAILAASSLPSMSHTSSQRLRRKTFDLKLTIDGLALEAMASRDECSIVFTPGENRIKIAKSSGKTSYYSLPNNISVKNASFGNLSSATTLALRASGSATPGSITLVNNKNNICTITQALRGARNVYCSN